MNRQTVRFGVLVGVVGGLIMALTIMALSAALGEGLLTPVNVIAHTFWKGAPLDGAVNFAALGLGVAIHLVISIALGLILATLVEHNALDGGSILMVAVVLGSIAWIVQAFAWPAVDEVASSTKIPWAFALAHVVFSVASAIALLKLEHLAPESVSEPALA